MLWRLIRSYLRPYSGAVTAVVTLQLIGTFAALYLPSLNAAIIDKGIVTGDTGYILRRGGLMLAVSVVQTVCSIAAVWYSARTAMAFGRDLRRDVFAQVGSFSEHEVSRFGAPSLITRDTNDVQQVQMLVLMGGTMAVAAPIMMVGAIVMALREDVGLSWLIVAVVPLLAGSIGFLVSRMVPNFRLMQERIDELNRVLREQITGVRVVRAFVRERVETNRFATANDRLTDVALRTGRWQAGMFPTVMLVANLSSIGVIWFGGHRVEAGQMEVGAITAYISYLMQIVMSVMMGTFMMMLIPRAAVCADRITEVLDTESSVRPPEHPRTDQPEPGTVRFAGVEFRYPGADAPVLRDLSFVAEPGQTVAVIGSTGAGKTTLVNLIPRLFDATAGSVSVGGVGVSELDQQLLWSQLGLVPQKAFLFTGPIADNLRYGKPDATEEEIWQALEIAQARDFVAALPEGLDTAVAQGGTNFSGGQRQRLAIARAIIRRPAIYLFDDAFSALDLATDARLRAALRPITREATVLVVAQRVSSIRDADQILVLEDGAVVGRGTHTELLEECSTYREIVESQLSAEEAA